MDEGTVHTRGVHTRGVMLSILMLLLTTKFQTLDFTLIMRVVTCLFKRDFRFQGAVSWLSILVCPGLNDVKTLLQHTGLYEDPTEQRQVLSCDCFVTTDGALKLCRQRLNNKFLMCEKHTRAWNINEKWENQRVSPGNI